ncbi:putative phospholipid-transporting ATPase IF isoform X5 [Aix galericulata]|nr:putative phospholipid-transporting ATPase IF isoform X5 [Aix galericulata]
MEQNVTEEAFQGENPRERLRSKAASLQMGAAGHTTPDPFEGQKFGLQGFDPPHQSDTRTIYIANRFPQHGHYVPQKFADNRIISSKYTVWNFVPKNLFEQFRRVANFYFLIIFLVQLMIDTPTSPITSGLPLFFVITVTAIKQGYEDWLRHKADNEVNGAPVYVVRSGGLVKTRSKNIRVGDIVRVAKDETFPVDLVLLSSDRVDGSCHVTTASLDGETNLKTHVAVPETAVLQSVANLDKLVAVIECQQPEADLYRFVGRITISQQIEEIVRSMNSFLIIYLIILLFEAILSTILKYAWQAEEKWDEPWYNGKTEHERNSSKILRFISDFLAFLVLYNFIIPISLYVTVEMQKFLGSFFIGWDLDLYHEETNQRAQVNTSDLNEELGQVEYVFTDKTGTLTENEMQFRECSINGIKYQEVNGKLTPEGFSEDSPDGNMHSLMKEEELFLKAVCLCHTVQINADQTDGADGPWHANGIASPLEYYASSPDEKALVEAASRVGVVFTGTSGDSMEVKSLGKPERRMSVIVESPSGEKLLFTKGAESSILPRSKSGEIDKTRVHVDEFALKGLRTLCVAYRRFTPEEYQEICKRLHEARTALQQREERLADVFNFIERDLELLGATGVEDKLQEKVQETIEALRLAGIKVWVLTGDKHETAVSVSLSCGHFHRTMNILELVQHKSDSTCAEQLRQLAKRIKEDHVIQHGLVVDGTSLSLALREHEKLFMEVCKNCSAVLCCRMAPLQKAKVVRLLKTSPEKPITLAIGDGANDVSMIQEAHVGIGIMGKEGRQAVRNSDYAIARFKFLSKLLFVHGHFYYIRIATLVQYFFYKNVCFITPQFLYQFFCLFSQQTLYDSVYLTLYNICFTSLPVLIYSLFEQHVHPHVLQSKPVLYRDISKNAHLGYKPFLYWTILGFFHAFIFFYGSYLLMGEDTSLLGNGQMFGNWTFGTLVFTVMVITVTMKMALETHFWTWINHFVTWGSIVFYFIFSLFYGGIIWPFLHTQDMYFVFVQLLSSGSAWFAIILIVVACLFLDVVKKVLYRHLQPTSTEKAQMYSNRVALSDEFIALQPLSRARNQLSKIRWKKIRVQSAQHVSESEELRWPWAGLRLRSCQAQQVGPWVQAPQLLRGPEATALCQLLVQPHHLCMRCERTSHLAPAVQQGAYPERVSSAAKLSVHLATTLSPHTIHIHVSSGTKTLGVYSRSYCPLLSITIQLSITNQEPISDRNNPLVEEERRGTRATEPHEKKRKNKQTNKKNIFTFLPTPNLLKTNKQTRQVDLRGAATEAIKKGKKRHRTSPAARREAASWEELQNPALGSGQDQLPCSSPKPTSPTRFSHWTFSYEDASVRPILRPGSSPAAGNWGRLCASQQTLSTKQDRAETFTKVRQLMLSKPCGRTSRNDE